MAAAEEKVGTAVSRTVAMATMAARAMTAAALKTAGSS